MNRVIMKPLVLLSLLIFAIFLSFPTVLAADQTQQFNKIFLDPFYRESMAQNTNYSYIVKVNPPDGISNVRSAIVTIDAYINPTRTFIVLVNNQSCNNPTYTVSTTYAGAGKSTVYFDCSNVITRSGNYEVKIAISGGGIGATTAWLDLTYMNKPGKNLDIFGTEYTVGDSGKVFIQLLENQMTAINNASCYISIYYPSGTKWIDESLMTYQTGSAGLYYYNFNAPSTLGVYMTDIFCEYYTQTQKNNASAYSIAKGWYVAGTGASVTNIDSDYLQTHEYNFNTGAVANVTTVLMAHLDEYTGTSTLDSSASPTTGTHFNTPTLGVPGQAGSVAVRYGTTATDYTQFSAASKLNLLATENFMMCFSFNESISNANGNRLISGEATDVIRFSFDGGNLIRFITDRSGTAAQQVQSPLTYVDSQWHTVCGYQNASLMYLYIDGSLVATTTVAQSGTLTLSNGLFLGAKDGGGNDVDLTSMDEVCYMKGTEAQFASPSPGTLATAYNTNKQCGVPNYNLDQNVTISGITFLPEYYQADIVSTYRWTDFGETVILYLWNYTGNSWYQLPNALSYSPTTDSTVSSALTNISSFVSGGNMIIRMNDSSPTHATAGRLSLNQIRLDQTAFVEVPANQIRGGGEIHVTNIPRATTDLVNAETPGYVWNHLPNRNLTYYPTQSDLTNYTKIASDVWNYTDRNLTYYADVTNYTKVGESVWTSSIAIPSGLLTQITNAVWSAPNRNLTYYADTTNYTLIGQTVWGYTGVINVNLLTQVATAIWTSPDRNLTFYPTQVDLTNYTLVANSVWNNAIRNLTYYENFGDQTNYTKINSEVPVYVWNYATRNLTYYEHIDMTNYSQAAQYVWQYVNRSLTSEYINNISAQEIWDYTNRTLTYYQNFGDQTNYTKMVEDVWAYVNRSLTYYQNFGDQTNYTLINEGVTNSVWTAPNRNLTYYQNFGDQTNYTQIILGVWSATDRNLTFYPAQTDLTNYTAITENVVGGVWNATNRSLTFYPQQIDLTNYSQIADVVWNANTRNLTFTEDVTNYSQIIVGVWNYVDRNLTFYPVQVDLTNYTKITQDVSQGVWLYSDRNLTYYEHVDMTNYTKIAEDVWSFATRNLTFTQDVTDYNMIILGVWNATDRNLTFYPVQTDLTNYSAITNNVVNGVWNATDRNLTFYPTQLDLTNYSQISEVVWNYVSRNLTYTQDVTDYNQIIVGVWNFTDRNLTFYPVQTDLTNYTKIAQDTASAVWIAPDRNLTYYEHVDMTNYTKMAENVWNYVTRNLTFTQDVTDYNMIIMGVWNATDRNLTFYPVQSDLTNYTAITENVVNGVWNATTRNLTFYPTQLDLTNYSQISEVVWNYVNRNLTYTADVTDYNKIIIGVWNFTDRNLTFYPVQTDLTNYTLISDTVWSAPNRNLTFYADVTNYTLIGDTVWGYTGVVNGNLLTQVATAIWSASDRNLTFYPTQTDLTNYTQIADSVWNAAIRNLTFYPTQVDLTNYTLIASTVWTSTDRNLTFYADPTDYNKIFVGVWNNTDRNLTFYPAQIDMTNYTLIIGETANAVWNATNRNLTFYPTQSDLTNYTEIANVVWNAASRNLTYYQNFGDQTNYTEIVLGVWNATDRNLTFYPAQVDLTNYTAITENVVNGVWNATDRNLTFYPTAVDLTNYSQIADVVWNAGSRNLTYTADVTNYSQIIVGVWNYQDRNLTFYPVQVDLTNYTLINDMIVNNSINYTLVADNVWQWNGVIVQNILNQIGSSAAQNVWNATDRNLTFYPTQVDLTNYSLISESVWQNLNRTLTDFNFTVSVNETAISNAVWTSVTRTLTDFNFTVTADINNTAVADAVWAAVNRTLTDYNQSDLTDYNKIQTMVWNATDRNLTYYQNFGDQTNYTLIGDTVWQNLNRTLTDFNFTVSVNESAISNAVWTAVDRTLTSFNFTVEATVNNSELANAVWSAVNRTLTDYNQSDLTDYNKIQTMVWNATDRNLTYYQNFGDQTNYTLIQQMVWTATQRTLTELNFTVDVNASAIAQAVWDSTVRTLTDYNHTDSTNYNLIQTMVWNATTRTLTEINLNNVTVNATIDNTAVANAVWTYTNKTVDFATTGNTETVALVDNIANMGHTYVGGTEYIEGENGKVAIRLVRGTGSLAEVEVGANCSISITYPNVSYYVFNQSMTELGDGAYYYNFIVPPVLGVYPYMTNCHVDNRSYFSLDDFHVYENNYSSIPGEVWSAPVRNLTFYPAENNLTANDIWNAPTRELTFYPTTNISLTNESIQELGNAVWNYGGTINANILTQFSSAVSCTIQKLQSDLNLKWGVQLNTC